MKTKIIILILLGWSVLFALTSAEELKFYGNAELNICIPFDSSISFAAEGGLSTPHGNIKFDTNCLNSCYVPLFGARWWFWFGHTYTYQYGRKYWLYFDCNETTKEEVIEDYCKEIEENIIDVAVTKKCTGGVFSPSYWMCNLSQMHQYMHQHMNKIWKAVDDTTWNEFTYRYRYRYGNKKYIAVFEKNIDNKIFYDTYCKDDNYKKDIEICYNNQNKFVKLYDVWTYLEKWAVLWKCLTTNGDVGKDVRCNLSTDIENWNIKLNNVWEYKIKVKYLGGRFAYGNQFALRVTSRVKVGDKYFEAKGNYNNPLLWDVNYTWGTQLDITTTWNTDISIESTAWDLKDGWDSYSPWKQITYSEALQYVNKLWYQVTYWMNRYYYRLQNWVNPDYLSNVDNWVKYKTVVWGKDNENTIVLKKGDSIDKILQYYDETAVWQPGVWEFISDYVKDWRIDIKDNQLLYLFEFNDLDECKANKTCDYQDSIVLIEIDPVTNNEIVDCSIDNNNDSDTDDSSSNNDNENEDDTSEEDNNEDIQLPPYLRVDYENSELIFDFARDHELKR